MAHPDVTPDGVTLDGLVRMARDRAISRRAFLERAALLLGGAAAAEGLWAQAAAAQTTAKRDLVVAQGNDVSKFDPHLSTSAGDIVVSFNLFDTLIARRADNRLYPSLATEWKMTSPTAWHLKLRQDVKWHNGEPFTAADPKFSLERTLDPKSKVRVNTVFTTIERIETPDPYTLVIHTKQPDPNLPGRLAFYGGQIVPRHYLEKVGPDEFNAKPIGTGCVRHLSWIKDERLLLEANPDYWGGKVDAEKVIFRPIPEVASRIASLLKGEVDIITKLPPDHMHRVNRNPTTRSEGALYAGLYVLAVNSKRPALDNPLVKQALSLAIDREAIVKELWRGRGIIPTGMISKGDNHFDETLPPFKHDPAEARERLKKSGYRNEEIVIETTSGYMAVDKPMAEAIIAMWRDIGVNGKVEVVEYSVRGQKLREKSFKGLWWSDPTSTLGDPDGMMWRLLHPGGPQDYWRHPRFDELGNAARFSVDEKFRGEAYREMTKIFLEYLPWIPIIQPYEDYGLQKYVEWKPYANQQFELRRFNFKFRRG